MKKLEIITSFAFCTTRLPSEHMELLVVAFSLLVFSSSLTSQTLFYLSWFLRPTHSGTKSFIPLPKHLSTPILEEYVPLRLKWWFILKIMCYWLDFCKSAYAICPDKFRLMQDLGCSFCFYPTWVGSMECFYCLSCGCGLVGCVSEADCPFLILYWSFFDSFQIPILILSKSLLTLCLLSYENSIST